MSNIFACFLQALACKLGSVTGKDLAQNCREHLPNKLRWPLYLLSELAIISTDLAEIIGGAIALNLLFNLNIIAGVIITAFDVFFILLLYHPNGTLRGIRWFELGVSLLVLGVVICFSVELAQTPNIDGKEVLKGFVPSGVVFTSNGIFASLGILGATIMPHALFLGSHVVLPRVREFDLRHHPERIEKDEIGDAYKWQPSVSAIRATLSYSIAEIVISLSTFAMFVNSAILIVAGTALYGTEDAGAQDLFSIHTLLSQTLAPIAGTLFALALLFSGQSSSIIATIVGQIICEGFINWKVRPFVRRGITRLIALIPCVVVASAIGKSGLNQALNISQVNSNCQLRLY
jgi:metal iron transporter